MLKLIGWVVCISTRYISGNLLSATHVSPCDQFSAAESIARPIYEYGYPRRVPAGERLVMSDDAGGNRPELGVGHRAGGRGDGRAGQFAGWATPVGSTGNEITYNRCRRRC